MNNIDLIRFLTNETKDIEIISGFKLFLADRKQNNTLGTYQYYLKETKVLLDFFSSEEIYFFQNITNTHILKLKENLKNKNLKNQTINKVLQTLKTCIKFLEDNEIISSLNLKITKLKETSPEIKILNNTVMLTIIEYILGGNIPLQMRVCLLLIVTTGVRRTELVNIKCKNICLSTNKIYLDKTKSSHPRYIYITADVKPFLVELCLLRKNSTYLFLDNLNYQANAYIVDRYFRKLKKDLDINNLSPHMLRHFYATTLINNNTDINSVRLLLGHQTLNMTLRYIDTISDQLQKENEKNNPITKLKK